MASKRIARLNEQLKREIAGLLRTEVRDPRIGLVSVTGVQVATDLGSARVFVQVLGDDRERAETLAGLDAAAPFLRRTLGQELRIRRIPELRFLEDPSLERAQRIERILSQVLPAEAANGGEGGPLPDGVDDDRETES